MAVTKELYPYSPSLAASIIFTIIFALLLGTHLWRLLQTRSWFCLPFILGCLLEAAGYGARAYGHYHSTAQPAFLVQTLTILVAPIFFAASVYMFLGRIILLTHAASLSPIRPSLLTKLFVGGDVLCFLVQAMGGGMMTGGKSASSMNVGKFTILGGLLLQLGIFGGFLVVAGVFERRMGMSGGVVQSWDWKRYMHMLYLVSVLITVRNAFRVAEYAMGRDGYLLSTEWPLYVFDATLMAAVLACAVTWYIGEILAKFSQGMQDEDFIRLDEENSRRADAAKGPRSGWTASVR